MTRLRNWMFLRMLAEKRAHRTTAAALKVARLDLAITEAHLRLARDQRDRTMDLLMADEWSPTDRAWLDELGVDG